MKHSRIRHYGAALVLTTAALLLTKSVNLLVIYHAVDLFLGAVFLSAWYGGFGPGLLASALSILAIDYFLLPPLNSFSLGVTDMIRLAVFGAVALVTSALSAKLKGAQLQLQQAYADLERRLEERTAEVLAISNREQTRLGQDLHDGLCQTLAGTRLLTEVLTHKLTGGGRADVRDVQKIESRLEEALLQANTVSRGLYPVELEANGLAAALQELAEKMTRLYPVVCRFVCRKPAIVHDNLMATHLYRIAQEAAINAMKGGKARHIVVRIFTWGPRIVLVVADDGAGFPPESAQKGMGLKIMDYRARAINALLQFRRRRRRGLLVVCSVSIAASAEVTLGT